METVPERRGQRGYTLVAVLVLSLVLNMLALAFVSLMNADQRHAGNAHRAAAALYLAEAGAEKALWNLARGGSEEAHNGNESLEGYREQLGSGGLVIEKIEEHPPGTVAITVQGEVGGVVRRIRHTVRLAPKALGFGLYAGRTAALARQARLYVVPLLPQQEACARLGDNAVASHLWVEQGVGLNTLDGQPVASREGSIPDYTLFGLSSLIGVVFKEREILPDLVTAAGGPLVYGLDKYPLYDLGDLRRKYPAVAFRARRDEEVVMPRVDMEWYRSMARENYANSVINKAAGEHVRDRALVEKRESLYTQKQFEQILGYMDAQNRSRPPGTALGLAGLVFVDGAVEIVRGLRIDDGGLVVMGIVRVGEQARLEVRHGPAAVGLPGLIASGDGGRIRLEPGASVVVDGLVLANTSLEIFKGTLDVSGAVLAEQGFVNDGGLAVIRYHPDVLGTMGLTRTRNLFVRPLSWQELF